MAKRRRGWFLRDQPDPSDVELDDEEEDYEVDDEEEDEEIDDDEEEDVDIIPPQRYSHHGVSPLAAAVDALRRDRQAVEDELERRQEQRRRP